MQLDVFAEPDGSCGKTCQEHSAQEPHQVATLVSWLERWLGADLVYRETDGATPELLSEGMDWSSGGCWTRNSSEWNHIPPQSPNDVDVCSLSSILETGPIDPRYCLSEKACAGILRRAAKRGKKLPEPLRLALEAVAG